MNPHLDNLKIKSWVRREFSIVAPSLVPAVCFFWTAVGVVGQDVGGCQPRVHQRNCIRVDRPGLVRVEECSLKNWSLSSQTAFARSKVGPACRVLIKVNLRLGQALPPFFQTVALHSNQNDNDSGEDGDDHPGDPDGNDVLLLEAFFDDVLGRFRRKGDDHVEAEVGDSLPCSILSHALESPVVVQVCPEQDQLTLHGALAQVDVLVVVEAHVDVAHHRRPVVDQQALVPPAD